MVILVKMIFNPDTYCFLFNKLLYRGDIPCSNPIGQCCVDDVVLRHILENAQDRVHHDAHLFQLNLIEKCVSCPLTVALFAPTEALKRFGVLLYKIQQ